MLEAAIALAVWMILSVSVLFVWQHISRTSLRLIAGQDAFENARVSMDALLINMQLAEAIVLETDKQHVLKELALTQYGRSEPYRFFFNIHATPGMAKYHRLEFGRDNEFASQIASVVIKHMGERMSVTVTTGGEAAEPLTFTGSVDIRYKDVKITQSP